MVVVYTDGSCKTFGHEKGGPGGWAWLIDDGRRTVHSGFAHHSTSTEMEILAAANALNQIDAGQEIEILTDCLVLVHGVEGDSPIARVWRSFVVSEMRHKHVEVRYLSRSERLGAHREAHMLVHKAANAQAGRINAMLNNRGGSKSRKRPRPPLEGWALHDEHRLLPRFQRVKKLPSDRFLR